jgi:THO complex subunit 2
VSKRRKERERLQTLIDTLQKELDAQERAVAARTKRLMIEKDHFLVNLANHPNSVTLILQECPEP